MDKKKKPLTNIRKLRLITKHLEYIIDLRK